LKLILHTFFCCCALSLSFHAQDIIYTIDASKIECKVVEISESMIYYSTKTINDSVSINQVYLIQYAKGRVERYSSISELTSNDSKYTTSTISKNPYSVSFNGLALFNSDITFMLERKLKNPRISIGVLGGYNFNKRVSYTNLFLYNLNRDGGTPAKKEYDLGIYILGRSTRFEKSRTSFLYGFMIKYMSFNFDKQVTSIISSPGTPTYSYMRTKGSQIAYLPYIGVESQLSQFCFFRGTAGLGVFGLFGDYKKQYNASPRRNIYGNRVNSRDALIKAYLNLSIGWQF
jgi:hypothetical protein